MQTLANVEFFCKQNLKEPRLIACVSFLCLCLVESSIDHGRKHNFLDHIG